MHAKPPAFAVQNLLKMFVKELFAGFQNGLFSLQASNGDFDNLKNTSGTFFTGVPRLNSFCCHIFNQVIAPDPKPPESTCNHESTRASRYSGEACIQNQKKLKTATSHLRWIWFAGALLTVRMGLSLRAQ